MKRIAYTHREFRLCEWPEEQNFNAWGTSLSDYTHEKEIYDRAVTSAMENGVAFEDQEKIKEEIWNRIGDEPGSWNWYPKEGDNWPAPQEAEIVTYWRNNEKEEWGPWHKNRGTRFSCEVAVLKRKEGVHFVHELINHAEVCTATILKSESVEKKESGGRVEVHKRTPKNDPNKWEKYLTIYPSNDEWFEKISEVIKRSFENQSPDVIGKANEAAKKYTDTKLPGDQGLAHSAFVAGAVWLHSQLNPKIADRLNQSTPKE